MPRARKTDVPLAPRLVLRFSAPVRVETVTSETVTLSGPEGPEAVTVIPAEGGMLAFIRPRAPLLPGATYTLSLNGAEDGRGLVLPFTAVQFRTREAPAGPEGAGVPPRRSPPADRGHLPQRHTGTPRARAERMTGSGRASAGAGAPTRAGSRCRRSPPPRA